MTVVHEAYRSVIEKRFTSARTIKLITIPAFPNNNSGFLPILSMIFIATNVMRTLTVPIPTVPKIEAEFPNPTFVKVFGA